MNEEKVLQIFNKCGAVIVGHFIYTSGKHGSTYINKDALYPHTKETSDLCRAIAKHFADNEVEAVVAPEKGGIILSQWVAFYLSEITGREVLAFYAEKTDDGDFVIKRGGAQLKLPGKNVLVVEDILTTGGSAKKVIEAVRALGGNVVGLGAVCNRGGVTLKDVANPQELFALLNVNFDTWEEAECPLCAQSVPHRHERWQRQGMSGSQENVAE